MGSYQIVRGSEKQGGYVSCVEKGRVNGSVRTIRHVCGLGVMTYAEFKTFQAWAVEITPQETRLASILGCERAITVRERAQKNITEHAQQKTTVKPVKKVKAVKLASKDNSVLGRAIREHEEIRREEKATATQKEVLAGRRSKILRAHRGKIDYPATVTTVKDKKTYIKIYTKNVEEEKATLMKEKHLQECNISLGGLQGSRKDRGALAMANNKIKMCDRELSYIEKERAYYGWT